MIGKTIRGYKIITELGAGGMGTVYFAEHPVIGRRAAIKVLNPEISGDESMVARLFNEARAVNAIRHPNIVDITDFGDIDSVYFIVMEFLEGETLGSRLELKTALDEPTARGILGQIAAAVGAVHDKGIIHRDLKPENIFLTNHPDYRDFVKVLDFGLVKMPDASQNAASNTKPGLVMGTPAYMSPEQCRGDRSLDRRADIYSIGAMAFELLTGRTIFEGNWVEQLHAHMNTPPPQLKEIAPKVTAELAALVQQCLAKAPAERPATMREVRDRLRGAASEAKKPADRKPPKVPTGFVHIAPAKVEKQERVEREQSERVSHKLGQIVSRRLAENTLVLPSPPTLAVKCLEMLDNADCNFAEIARTIEQDPLMAGKLLRLVNSAYYGTRVKTMSVDMAINRLGIKHTRLVLQEMAAETVFSSRNPRIRSAFRDIWGHCLAVAQLARKIAAALPGGVDPDLAYLAGLMHDIGKPVVAVILLEAERSLAEEDRQWMSETLWLRAVNRSHREIGETLAIGWRFPPEIVETVRMKPGYNRAQGKRSCVNIVRLANAMTKCEGIYLGPVDREEAMTTVVQGRELLGIDDKLEAELTKELKERVSEATTEL